MKRFYRKNGSYNLFIMVLLMSACGGGTDTNTANYDTLNVVATAYNSTERQTKKGNIGIAAWGDTLKPGMRAIAVSRDLIDSGLTHNTEVKIEGFEGTFLVKDKMHKRWTNKIDIYMGLNEEKAINWGKQEVLIFVPQEEEE
jgi:3D (Asp-Asp-Asp) domain-containing protein